VNKQYVVRLKPLVACLLIPFAVGLIGSLFTRAGMEWFEALCQPRLTPPNAVFSLVWSALYLLMGVSSYMVFTCRAPERKRAMKLYGWQLLVNLLWPFFFFALEKPLLGLIAAVALLVLVIMMVRAFMCVSKKAAWMNIPYIVWLVFAIYLNLGVIALNA